MVKALLGQICGSTTAQLETAFPGSFVIRAEGDLWPNGYSAEAWKVVQGGTYDSVPSKGKVDQYWGAFPTNP